MPVKLRDVREVSRRLLDLGLLFREESREGDDVGVDLLLRDWASFVTVGRHGVSLWVLFNIQGVVVQRQRSYNGKLVSTGKGKMRKSMGNGKFGEKDGGKAVKLEVSKKRSWVSL
jgi:hypothetical protein